MAKAKPSAETTTVTAVVAVEYDQVRYEAGETLDVRGGDLPQLLAVGAVTSPDAAAAE